MNYKILIVDDEAANLRLLERLLSPEYSVITAESGNVALDILARESVALIVSDQRMPGMTGIEFLKRAAVVAPQSVRIILTGYTDAEALVEAVNSGVVYKYVTKPWINSDLKVTIRRGLQHHETQKAQRILQENYTTALAELDQSRSSFTRFAAAVLHLNDPVGHARATRISKSAQDVARALDLTSTETDELQLSIFVRALLLSGGDRASGFGSAVDDAMRAVKKFEAGMQIMSDVPYIRPLISSIRHFNERYDGSGYPSRLSAEGIPMPARIAAVVIAYDEMVFPRPDKPKFPHSEAIEKLRAASGTKFDPRIVEVFARSDKPALAENMIPTDMSGVINIGQPSLA
jgi:response regulator RpfG family c-di-GMP phosphodiesterase